MNQIKKWSGKTNSHGFSVEVYDDTDGGTYLAKILTYTPLLFDDTGELRNKDIDQLQEQTKKWIVKHCGKISKFH